MGTNDKSNDPQDWSLGYLGLRVTGGVMNIVEKELDDAPGRGWYEDCETGKHLTNSPDFLSDEAALAKLIERMRHGRLRMTLECSEYRPGAWSALFYSTSRPQLDSTATGATRAEAICRAAMKAVLKAKELKLITFYTF